LLLQKKCYKFIYLDQFVEATETASVTITTFPPLQRNIVATNYENLQLTSFIAGSPFFCIFQYSFSQSQSFISQDACLPEYSLNCEKAENSFIFNSTILSPLQNDFSYEIVCTYAEQTHDTSDVLYLQVLGKKNYCLR